MAATALVMRRLAQDIEGEGAHPGMQIDRYLKGFISGAAFSFVAIAASYIFAGTPPPAATLPPPPDQPKTAAPISPLTPRFIIANNRIPKGSTPHPAAGTVPARHRPTSAVI